MSFKLLAIRPLTECDKQFLKNLEENRIYKFFNEYSFRDINGNIISKNDKSIIHSIDVTSIIPDNLYKKDNLEINISAIVGENGSGKSTIVELLYVAFYNFSIHFDILTPNIDDKAPKEITEDAVVDNLKIVNEFYSFKSSSNRKQTEQSLKILQERIDFLRHYRNKNKHPKSKIEFKKIKKLTLNFFMN
ncbi:hypothetical protein LPB90_03820 [Chryseobacterium sp. LC2016-29]|uniref:hypothetical protein n=1 Tax=Chryseobacterium sp. LC2016-29 TaxID=2897331 RepID=UPI001E34EFAB|nr:hypothetical protein [Chryseobacterium sp. LC2016-29]MCD0477566.1 hypothetical protein [Chryseobacterium sp. LC2016-29]